MANMAEIEKLAFDYDEFEYWYDTYGYEDAVGDRENGLECAIRAMLDGSFRRQIIERLQEIADEDDWYHDQALELIDRIKNIGGME